MDALTPETLAIAIQRLIEARELAARRAGTAAAAQRIADEIGAQRENLAAATASGKFVRASSCEHAIASLEMVLASL